MSSTDSSVKAGLLFESFKVDNLSLDMKRDVKLLSFKGMFNPDDWIQDIDIMQPAFMKADKTYLGGVKIKSWLLPVASRATTTKEKDYLIKFESSIVGVFKISDGAYDAQTIEKLVKYNIPSTLMPHLRALYTSTFANAGYGTVTLPLFNIQAIIDQNFAAMEIKEV